MSSSKFLFFGTSLLRTHKTLTSFPPFHLTKPVFFFSIRSLSLSSTAADTSSPSSLPRIPHPWPEWVSFVDKLKSKGYFVETPRKSEEEKEEISHSSSSGHDDMGNDVVSSSSIDEQIYRDMNLLKDPCLSFARDRFDIFKYENFLFFFFFFIILFSNVYLKFLSCYQYGWIVVHLIRSYYFRLCLAECNWSLGWNCFYLVFLCSC